MVLVRLSKTTNSVDANEVLPGLFIGGCTALSHLTDLTPTPKVVVSAAQDIRPQDYLQREVILEAVKHLPLEDKPTD